MPHIHKDVDWVIGYYLVYRDKVLLVYHIRLNTWTCPGGHVELAEDPEETVYREIEEEMGLAKGVIEISEPADRFLDREGFKTLPVPSYLNIHAANSCHRHIGMQYFVRTKTDAVKLDEREHSAARWFSETELDEAQYNIPPEIKFYAKEALRRLGS